MQHCIASPGTPRLRHFFRLLCTHSAQIVANGDVPCRKTGLQANLKQALAEKEALLRRLSVLEERDEAREARLARVERALEKDSSAATYVSVKRP